MLAEESTEQYYRCLIYQNEDENYKYGLLSLASSCWEMLLVSGSSEFNYSLSWKEEEHGY